jgi:hypothetical protein
LAFVDYSSELMGTIPKLSYLLAQKHVNRAWKKIRDSRHWSFLMLDTDIIMPSAVGAGTASVTQYTASVQFDATAKAALLNLANPVITKRQFRVAQGPVYSITAYDNVTGIATLDRLYIQATERGCDVHGLSVLLRSPCCGLHALCDRARPEQRLVAETSHDHDGVE